MGYTRRWPLGRPTDKRLTWPEVRGLAVGLAIGSVIGLGVALVAQNNTTGPFGSCSLFTPLLVLGLILVIVGVVLGLLRQLLPMMVILAIGVIILAIDIGVFVGTSCFVL